MAEHHFTANELNDKNSKVAPDQMAFHKIMQRYIPILLVNVLLIIVLAYFISPLSKVATITVTGNDVVYDQMIIDESAIISGDSVIQTIDKRESIVAAIENNIAQVAAVDVQLEDFNNIVINTQEFATFAYIAQDGSYLRVLENGQVLDDEFAISLGNQPVLSKFEEGEALNLMIEQLSFIETPILDLISEIEYTDDAVNPLMITVYMNNGNRVLASIPSFSEKMPYYPQMVRAVHNQKGLFDMEMGIYFIPFVNNDSEADILDEAQRQEIDELNN